MTIEHPTESQLSRVKIEYGTHQPTLVLFLVKMTDAFSDSLLPPRPCAKRKFTERFQDSTMEVYFRAEHCRAEH